MGMNVARLVMDDYLNILEEGKVQGVMKEEL